ncbi:hypothetical protein FDI24_gp161 [Acidovorax phage ACP17]|uniref:Uncharacterized protein n=1 Tax=Acidovorax phage ACP17 TaxID=2010329 RepID=A0A218M327_9CAUD|nr:hypothetical protein FDI24_gp161 [Acidovorax phage ACP17]ASD50443.1 hypothetical protein [Acidovorax phage ACP17]
MKADIKDHLERTIAASKKRLNEFSLAFAKEPLYTMRWADQTFEHAAKMEVYGKALVSLEAPGLQMEVDGEKVFNLRRCIEILQDLILHETRHPARSTSAMANIADQLVNAARCELLEDLKTFEKEGA